MSLSQGLNFDLVKPGVKPTYIIYANKINYPSLIIEETIQLPTAIYVSAIPFYGHVRRHDSLQRVILEGKVEGGKERAGRTTSRLIWGYQSTPTHSKALDRKKWRAMTPTLVLPP